MILDELTMNRWLDALRFLPSDPAQILTWIDGPLRRFFPFERVICMHGELVAGQIAVTHALAIGFTSEQQARLSSSFELSQRGLLARWLYNRQPFYLDPEALGSYATDFEIEEIRQNGMGNIVAHGVLNAQTNAGTYFSFAGITPPLSDWHLDAMRLMAPVLNDLFLANIAASIPHNPKLNALSQRQKEIVRHLSVGLCNKAIALKIGTTEKTVRNQLSVIYTLLNIHKRSQLQAMLR